MKDEEKKPKPKRPAKKIKRKKRNARTIKPKSDLVLK